MAANFKIALGEERNTCNTVDMSMNRSRLFSKHTGNRSEQVGRGDILHFTDSSSSFNVDHVRLVSQKSLQVFMHLFLDTGF